MRRSHREIKNPAPGERDPPKSSGGFNRQPPYLPVKAVTTPSVSLPPGLTSLVNCLASSTMGPIAVPRSLRVRPPSQ